jgi:hypothetical protein
MRIDLAVKERDRLAFSRARVKIFLGVTFSRIMISKGIKIKSSKYPSKRIKSGIKSIGLKA